MSDWALSRCERQEMSNGLASRGAANAKGAYVQIKASTGFQYNAIQVQLDTDGGGGQTFLVDIAFGGAGSEVVIIPNILIDSARAVHQNMVDLIIPIQIPAGTRLAARCQEVGGAGTRDVIVTLIGRAGGANYPQPSGGLIVNYGAITASTNGVLVDSGAVANAYGAWTEISAATSRDHSGIIAVLGSNKQTSTLVDTNYFFQIGVGGSGSEVAIAEFASATSSALNRFHVNTFDVAAQIPSGTRLAMRAKCVASGAAAARNSTAVILGY